MGKGILILVVGVAGLISLLIVSLNANTNRSLDTTLDMYKTTQARLISNSGVEVYLEKMRRDKDLTGTFEDNSLLGGNYNLYISGPDSDLIIRSVGTYDDKVHTSLVNAVREPVLMPGVSSALYISSNTVSLNLNGNVDIDGNDHDMNGNPDTHDPLPGVGVDDATDSAYVIDNVKSKITKTIKGDGGIPSVQTVPDTTDWLALSEEFIFSADTILTTGTYSSGSQFGTYEKPIITYCNGDVDFTDATGYGIMIINGNINLSGNFNYYGIVIVYGQSSIRCQAIGNNSIYGGTILIGNEVSIESQGNAQFYYSWEAINNGHLKLKSSRFKILSWLE
jgi:hypothetical protein